LIADKSGDLRLTLAYFFGGAQIFHSRYLAHFLANMNSRSRSPYAVARPSVVCGLSVVCLAVYLFACNARALYTQPVEIFGNVSTPFGTTLTIR